MVSNHLLIASREPESCKNRATEQYISYLALLRAKKTSHLKWSEGFTTRADEWVMFTDRSGVLKEDAVRRRQNSARSTVFSALKPPAEAPALKCSIIHTSMHTISYCCNNRSRALSETADLRRWMMVNESAREEKSRLLEAEFYVKASTARKRAGGVDCVI